MSNFVEIKDKDGVTLGQLPVSSEGGRLRNIIYMTESGTYEKPAWLKFIRVRGVGGGGGGGGVTATSASQIAVSAGGGGGGYFEKKIAAADLSASETVTVGADGAAGSAGQNNGGAGGTTSFGALCSATGGAGGLGGAAVGNTSNAPVSPVAGGVGAGGDINVPGESSLRCGFLAPDSGGSSVAFAYPLGGKSFMGSTTSVAINAAANNGVFGSGGSGVISGINQAARPGGAGAPGIVIIEEYE